MNRKKIFLIIKSILSVSIIGVVSFHAYQLYQYHKPLVASGIKASNKDCLSVKDNNIGSPLILSKCNKQDIKQKFIYIIHSKDIPKIESFQLLDNKCFKVKNNNLVVGKCDGKNDKKLMYQSNILNIPSPANQLLIVDNNINKINVNNNLKCLHYDIDQRNVKVDNCTSGKKIVDSLKNNNIKNDFYATNSKVDPMTTIRDIMNFNMTHYNEFWMIGDTSVHKKPLFNRLYEKLYSKVTTLLG